MVALKLAHLHDAPDDPLRSRNAVVALKLDQPIAGATAPSAKQERRGGIETGVDWAGIGRSIIGSRNAVVALKPRLSPSPAPPAPQKQERRGGIETRVSETKPLMPGPRSRNAVVALKLRSSSSSSARPSDEAGTPWWH